MVKLIVYSHITKSSLSFSRLCLAVKVDVDTVHVTQQNGVGVTYSADVHELKLMLRNQVSRSVSLYVLGFFPFQQKFCLFGSKGLERATRRSKM